ncbi:hypothetical protein [Mesorhizobium sp. ORS 3428]|uniref:hypothetical protein n=1 Tax=Mesorhizobium sp. ORS 3428 TaxID=540997 RepID=UPI001041DE3E|nr:hypothetical protein [Mesorhizobium sp. ORS 3428]
MPKKEIQKNQKTEEPEEPGRKSMLNQTVPMDNNPPAVAARRRPPALRQCCDSYVCPVCDQVVELTDFRQVVWHQKPGHKPMEFDD